MKRQLVNALLPTVIFQLEQQLGNTVHPSKAPFSVLQSRLKC